MSTIAGAPLSDRRLARLALLVAALCLVGLALTWVLAELVLIALRRRLPWVALAVALLLPWAPLTAELLKPLLAHHHDQIGPRYIANASWPSGHATAATALVWCVLLV